MFIVVTFPCWTSTHLVIFGQTTGQESKKKSFPEIVTTDVGKKFLLFYLRVFSFYWTHHGLKVEVTGQGGRHGVILHTWESKVRRYNTPNSLWRSFFFTICSLDRPGPLELVINQIKFYWTWPLSLFFPMGHKRFLLDSPFNLNLFPR